MHNLTFFRAKYNNSPSPPPYLYEYTITLKSGKEGSSLGFQLNYLDRDELEEEEIYEEGFTLNDDFIWEGFLPEVWVTEIKKLLSNTSPGKDGPSNIHLEFGSGEEIQKMAPENIEHWDYFLQELVQAIFEIGEKENPLEIVYREIEKGKELTEVRLTASFALRKAEISQETNTNKLAKKSLSWEDLKNLLALVYLPDYDYENADHKEPTKPGKYLNTGEGLWFKFGQSVTNPNKKNDALKRIEASLKNI